MGPGDAAKGHIPVAQSVLAAFSAFKQGTGPRWFNMSQKIKLQISNSPSFHSFVVRERQKQRLWVEIIY